MCFVCAQAGAWQFPLAAPPSQSKRDFPIVEVLSDVGWMVGGVTLSLTLPHTPPKKAGKDVRLREILGLDALARLRKPVFAIFIECMLLICIPL